MASQVESIKWIPGTKFMVDGFRFQHPSCQSYFLTHFHGDHTTGLTKDFHAGTLYCSQVTADLLQHDMGMRPDRIQALPLDKEVDVNGVKVTLIDANHCPGAVMLLFKLRAVPGKTGPKAILHTGDLRWHPRMAEHPGLRGTRLDALFLDTTYAHPKHVHPPQEEAIAQIVDLMRAALAEEPRTLFVVGSYHIGKERAYLGSARQLGMRVWACPAKRRVLSMLGLPNAELALLTNTPKAASVHVAAMSHLQPEKLAEKLACGNWARVVAFRPTGWTFRKSGLEARREGRVTIYGVPYSEHSSWPELRDCVARLRPRRLVPTVNAANPEASRAVLDRFIDLLDEARLRDPSRMDRYLRPKPCADSPRAASMDGDVCTPGASTVCRADYQDAAGQQLAGPCGGTGDSGGLVHAASAPNRLPRVQWLDVISRSPEPATPSNQQPTGAATWTARECTEAAESHLEAASPPMLVEGTTKCQTFGLQLSAPCRGLGCPSCHPCDSAHLQLKEHPKSGSRTLPSCAAQQRSSARAAAKSAEAVSSCTPSVAAEAKLEAEDNAFNLEAVNPREQHALMALIQERTARAAATSLAAAAVRARSRPVTVPSAHSEEHPATCSTPMLGHATGAGSQACSAKRHLVPGAEGGCRAGEKRHRQTSMAAFLVRSPCTG